MSASWVWDNWWAYDDARLRHHLFFLHAPTSLGDPELRHDHARIGHASSPDLVEWHSHPAPLPEPAAGFDDLASWTGCAVRDPSDEGDEGGGWWLFTTGRSGVDDGRVQRIGAARSEDLESWERTSLLLEADPAFYQCTSTGWPEEHWRDPWVVRDEAGTWHMYVTARDASGSVGCGVIGHATSRDLRSWDVQPPLSAPTGRFGWLEVISVVRVEGRWVLVFSCLADQMPGAEAGSGGVWTVPVAGPGQPVDVAAAVLLSDEGCYAAHVVEHAGASYLLGFRNHDAEGRFVGGVGPAVPVHWREDGAGLEFSPLAESIEHSPVHPAQQPLV